jgi:hypothetical protein
LIALGTASGALIYGDCLHQCGPQKFDHVQAAYSSDREQSFHAMVNGAWKGQLEIAFLRQVFTIRQRGRVSAGVMSCSFWISLSTFENERAA